MRRLLAALAGLALLASCGGRAEVFADNNNAPAVDESALPAPIPAVPVFALETKRSLTQERLDKLGKVDGVAIIAPVTRSRLSVKGPRGRVKLNVASVDPLAYRSVAPPATRDAEFVWVSLILGRAVPSFKGAEALGVTGQEEIAIGDTRFAVGAIADNGTPNVADLLVTGNAQKLELGEPTLYIVGAGSGVTVQALRKDLAKASGGAKLSRLIAQDTVPAQQAPQGAPQPVGVAQGGVIGSMSFEILDNGFIRPDPAWVEANIVSASVPIFGSVTCHRLMIPRLQEALSDVVEAGLDDEIRTGDYGGCYVPRFIDRDPGKPLSNHAFGLAIDFNVSTNQLGTRGDMHPGIVEIFQRWGFTWGGYWSRPDPMHFELSS